MTDISKRKIELEATMDASGIVAGTEAAKNAMRGMANEANQQSQNTANSAAKIPEGVAKAAQASERQIRSMISAIQRAEAEAATISNKASDRLENLAKIRGIPQESIEPYIRSLRATEAAQEATARGMNNMGLSAKQMQASMRGLPAQFTDIFTSLATGQAPLTVLLQQGGQIKDMFGGLVPAMKAIGTAIMGLINPFTLGAAAIAAFGYSAYQATKETKELKKALSESGGGGTGLSLGQLQQFARDMDEVGSITQGKAVEALTQFVKVGNLAGDQLKRFALTAAELEQVGGPAIEKTMEAFKSLGKDPLKSVAKLNEEMNFLSRTVVEQIIELERQGKTLDATRLAQEAFNKALKQQKDDAVAAMGDWEKAWEDLKKIAKETWDEMIGVSRENPMERVAKDIAAAQKALYEAQQQRSTGGVIGMTGYTVGGGGETPEQRLERLRQEQFNLQEKEKFERRSAERQAQQKIATQAILDIEAARLRLADKEDKKAREIAEIKVMIANAGWSAAKAAEVEAEMIGLIEKKYADKGKKPTGAESQEWIAKEYIDAWKKFEKIGADAAGVTDDLSKSQKVLYEIVTSPGWNQMSDVWKDNVFDWYDAAEAAETAADAVKEFNKVWEKFQKDADTQNNKFARETTQLEEGTKALRKKASQLGLNAEAQRKLNIQENDAEILRLQAIIDSGAVLDDLREQERILQRIAALKDRNAGEREAGEKEAVNAVTKEWEKAAEQIEQSLTDALMSGFDNGKSYGQNVADALKNSFKTFTAKLIIEPMVGAGVRGMMGMFGIPTSSPAGGGFGIPGLNIPGLDMGSIGTAIASPVLSSAGAYGLATGTSGAQAAMLAAQTGEFGLAGLTSTAAASGSTLAGLGSALMTAAPYLAAAYMAYSIYRGNKANHRPAQQNYGVVGMADPWSGMPNIQSGSAYNAMLTPISSAVEDTARRLGGSAAGIGYGLYSSASPDGRGAQTVARVDRDGRNLYYYDENASNESMDQRLKDQLPKMILAGMQAADLPQQFEDYFKQFDVQAATEETVNAIMELANAAFTMADAFKQLGGPFEQLSMLSVEARGAILDMVGGLDQFLGKTSGYFQNYYTQSEQQALSLASVDKTLTGVGLDPDSLRTKEDFRALVEKLDPNDPTQAKQLAALLNSADAFNFGVGLLESTGKTLGDVTAGAPPTAGVDLMVQAQDTTNSLLERIEAAVKVSGEQTVAAIQDLVTGGGYAVGGGTTEVVVYGANDGGGGA